jgi:arabinoxylan arabinofuranohydrolase
MSSRHWLAAAMLGLLQTGTALATNPFITDQFTADPTARVFEGKVYVYPSHDIREPAGYTGRPNWFVMEDYHVFSSENLTDWQDHGVVLTRSDVQWADQSKYAMWAPDCVFKDGKYYFYFPAMAKDGGGMRIGVAVGDKPYGPFKPLATPIEGVKGIDPGLFLDKDGSAYMSWSFQDKLFIAKLKPNMVEIEGEPQAIDNLPKKGLQEGPFEFERNGTYYLTYPHKADKIERLEYATSQSPLGPFQWAGVILDESPTGCWTVHQSMVEYRGQWYLFYHDRDLSPDFDKRRSIRAEKMAFNADGTIQKVTPTLRGVGLVAATGEIQIDRYSQGKGVQASFLDAANPHVGWKLAFAGAGSEAGFSEVDFGRGRQKYVDVRARAAGKGAGEIEIRLDKPGSPVVARVQVGEGSEWTVVHAAARKIPDGVHELIVTQRGAEPVEIDWIRFR